MAPATDVLVPGGTVLGRHRVLGRITEGAMAMLYLGEHVETGAKVAVKVLRSSLVDDAVMLARFAREAEVMGRLSGHDNIAAVHDVGTLDDGRRYLVMDLVRGSDLAFALGELAGEPMPADRACRILRDLANGLAAAHAKKVVHRDVTPANVMLAHHFDGSGETAKLVDFGVSSDLGAAGRAADLTVGAVIGTPEYMAPEQASGAPAWVGFDIFALGVIGYEMLTGKRPSISALRTGQVPALASLRSDMPREIVELVHGCLRVDAGERIGSAQEVVTRLDAALTVLANGRATEQAWAGVRPERAAGVVADGAAVDDVVRVTTESHLIDRARPRRWLAAGLLIALAGASGWWIWRTREPSRSGVASERAHPSEPKAASVAADPAAEPARAPTPVPRTVPEVAPAPSSADDEGAATPTADPKASPREPKPRPRVKPTPTPPPSPASEADHETSACQELRAEVSAAKRSQDWSAIAAKTADRSCWPTNAERLRYRTAALLELGRIDDCIREGGSSTDAKVKLQVEQCRRKKDQ